MEEKLRIIFNRWRGGNLKDFQPNQEYIAQFEQRKLAERMVKIFNETTH